MSGSPLPPSYGADGNIPELQRTIDADLAVLNWGRRVLDMAALSRRAANVGSGGTPDGGAPSEAYLLAAAPLARPGFPRLAATWTGPPGVGGDGLFVFAGDRNLAPRDDITHFADANAGRCLAGCGVTKTRYCFDHCK